MPEVTPLPPELVRTVSALARALVAAARTWTLYPPEHPAVRSSLQRLIDSAGSITSEKPLRLQATPDTLVIAGSALPPSDQAVQDLAALLHRHLVGSMTVDGAADAEAWSALLALLSRPPEQVRADGGIAQLWTAAGKSGIELREIDYAEVLRDKGGRETTIEAILAAATGASGLALDDGALDAFLARIDDPAELEELMARLADAARERGENARGAAVMNLLRAVVTGAQALGADHLDTALNQLAKITAKLSAGEMQLLVDARASRTPDGDIAGAVLERMDDNSIAEFVATSATAERGAMGRLAHVFQALVPDVDRRRYLLGLAEDKASESELGEGASFEELRQQVESMVATYSDSSYVSESYAQELFKAQTRAAEIEQSAEDPPERIRGWLTTVDDGALRRLDQQLLQDLLLLEEDPSRWRDVAETAAAHADDLVRNGFFAPALELTDAIITESSRVPGRGAFLDGVLGRLVTGSMMKSIAVFLRTADEPSIERFQRLCHAIGTPAVTPLAQALAGEQDARARKRLRDTLVSFGAAGRDVVQQLMHATNWEVRKTAAFLLREFGGAEGLRELIPLLSDSEPLVQREAVHALIRNGSVEAARLCLAALQSTSGRSRQTLIKELTGSRDAGAAPFLCQIAGALDPGRHPKLYLRLLEALGPLKNDLAIDTLETALYRGPWWAPGRARRHRAAAAAALRRIGSARAVEALRTAAARGSRGTRAVANAELVQLGRR